MTQASSEPHYERVKQFIRDGIARGIWSAESRIPSEAELTRLFKVSRMTVNRGLRELATEGLINRVQGVGSFVANGKAEATMIEVRGIRDEIGARGQVHTTRVVRHEILAADPAMAARFALPVRTPLFYSYLVHCADGEPLQIEERYCNPAVVPQYLEQDFSVTTPHDYLMASAPLERAEHVIEAQIADGRTARDLGLPPNTPVLVLNRRTFSAGVPTSAARLIYPASRFKFVGQFSVGRAARASTHRPAPLSLLPV